MPLSLYEFIFKVLFTYFSKKFELLVSSFRISIKHQTHIDDASKMGISIIMPLQQKIVITHLFSDFRIGNESKLDCENEGLQCCSIFKHIFCTSHLDLKRHEAHQQPTQ